MVRQLVCLLVLIMVIRCQDDYYEIMNIQRDASEQDIKKAFRQLSKKYHPDKNPGDNESAQHYVRINKAYEVLSDREKRQIYDLHGEEGLQQNGRPSSHDGFDDFFGFGGHQQNNYHKKGPNAEANINVSLEDLYKGTTREFKLKKNVICPICRGTGSKDGNMKVCTKCGGQGVRMETVQAGMGFTMQMQTTCDKCSGKGRITIGNCQKCSGHKVIEESKVLKIQVEKGMKDRQKIVFHGESEQSPDYLPGDVIFRLQQKEHPNFRRVGSSLHHNMVISLQDSLFGFVRQIRHLDGRVIEIKSDQIIQPFQVRVVKDEGMPVHESSSYGDLHVKFIINLPSQVDQRQRDIIQQIFQ